MRILFLNGQPFLPQQVGGVETSTLDLCLTLRDQGHHSAVMCTLLSGQWLYVWNRLRGRLQKQLFPADRRYGMDIYRGWDIAHGLDEVVHRERPDAIVVQGGHYSSYAIAAASARRGLPTFYYTHDLGVICSDWTLPDMTGVTWIANSAFTAAQLAERLHVSADIVPPLMRPESYTSAAPSAPVHRTVTVVNPRPLKGGHIAVAMAEQCPDIPFVFVEAWTSDDPAVAELRARALRLHNARWLATQSDMRAIYASTRVLLAPSQCPETWGRVITEAQFLGIPALASRIGALPDTVGPGGLTVDANAAPEEWVRALRSLWDDADGYRHYAEAARQFAQREDIAPAHVARKFVGILQAQLARHGA
jgi:glycosyltransferase involved in cell wall biosynthesis